MLTCRSSGEFVKNVASWSGPRNLCFPLVPRRYHVSGQRLTWRNRATWRMNAGQGLGSFLSLDGGVGLGSQDSGYGVC